jgi:hypothetical protein
MQEVHKAGYQAPDLSFFVPSRGEELGKRETELARLQKAPWQPRWTILFSLSAGLGLWAFIFWLAGL